MTPEQIAQLPTPETDRLSMDSVIERRDVPFRVWRAMAGIEQRLAAAVRGLEQFVTACKAAPPIELITYIDKACKHAEETLTAIKEKP